MTHYLISGGTGLVGSHIVDQLLKDPQNHIYILSRSSHESEHQQVSYINWGESGWEAQVPHIDVVINLAGATLNKRWTDKHKQLMMTSRIQSTRALYDLFKERNDQPDVLFNASAMGYYPPSKNNVYTEHDRFTPQDILSEIVYQWENQARLFEQLGTRVVIGRFSLILSSEGGALPMMKLPYQLMVGGRLGDGKQPYSWIHIDDLVQAILFLIQHQSANGVYNMSTSHTPNQNQFGKILGKVLHKPHYTYVPSLILKTVLGEMSKLILNTQHIVPKRLLQEGFTFKHSDLKEALQHIYNK
ncbi:TIGR01777 family oxidoreductase [Staphylococcus sp. 11261D007BR]